MTRLQATQRRRAQESSAFAHTSGQASTSGRGALMEGLEPRMLLSATWTVNTLNDVIANDRRLSLREAIGMSASGDKIIFATRIRGTIVLQNGELSITNKNLRINGEGRLTVSGNDASRVFHITGSAVRFNGLTIADGAANGLSDYVGGGIRNDSGSVTLTNCTVTGCAAESGGGIRSFSGSLILSGCTISSNTTSGGFNGGGIDVRGGAATITGCTFSGNHASVSGGGVSVASGTTLTLTNSTFDGNSGISGGGIASGGTLNAAGCTFRNSHVDYGGGVMNRGTATFTNCTISGNSGENGAGVRNSGTISLVGCTISGNRTIDYGGAGLHNTYKATLTNCTLSGNIDSSGYGGAAIRNSSGATLEINNCTISGNTANYAPGGGIRTDSASGVVLRNTIVSGNTGDVEHSGSTAPNDIAGTVDPSSSHNLIGIGGGLTNGVSGNIVGVTDPTLGSLRNNGGATRTMALLSGSPAINAGDNSLISPGIYYDQCGHARTRGTVDIGACEFQGRGR